MARQIATSWDGRTSRRLRKKIEMLFAHLKRILQLDRLRLRGPNGARDEFILAAIAQNLRKMAKLMPMLTLRPHKKQQSGMAASAAASLQGIIAGLFQRNRPQAEVGGLFKGSTSPVHRDASASPKCRPGPPR
jgi:hypothetical protein